MSGLSKDIRLAIVMINRLAGVARQVDDLISKSSSSRVRKSLLSAKSVLDNGRQRIAYAAKQHSPWAAEAISLQAKAKGGPNCGTGAGGFKQGNNCASGGGGASGKVSGSTGGKATAEQQRPRRRYERKIDPNRPKFTENSEVEWEYGVQPPAHHIAAIKKALGPNYKKRALALSGVPDGSKATLSYDGSSSILYVRARNETLGTTQNRYIYFGDETRKPYIYNAYFDIDDDKQGGGLGAEIFFSQVEAACRAKYDRIEVTAARSSDMNGYYTWARFGYDADVNSLYDGIKNLIRRDYPEAKRVSDIMKTKKGREWWSKNASTWKGTFDLKRGSKSRKIIRNYMAGKRRAYRAKLDSASAS